MWVGPKKGPERKASIGLSGTGRGNTFGGQDQARKNKAEGPSNTRKNQQLYGARAEEDDGGELEAYLRETFPTLTPQGLQEIDQSLRKAVKDYSNLDFAVTHILQLLTLDGVTDKALNAVTEAFSIRLKSNCLPFLAHAAVSEGLKYLFNVGGGMAKLDLTGIRSTIFLLD